jgi:hypothetical protein
MRLFDFNQDGKLTPAELLTGFALDSVVSEDQIDAQAVKVRFLFVWSRPEGLLCVPLYFLLLIG